MNSPPSAPGETLSLSSEVVHYTGALSRHPEQSRAHCLTARYAEMGQGYGNVSPTGIGTIHSLKIIVKRCAQTLSWESGTWWQTGQAGPGPREAPILVKGTHERTWGSDWVSAAERNSVSARQLAVGAGKPSLRLHLSWALNEKI